MALYDQHLHSVHSMDSRAEPAANVQAALDRGLAGLTFTEHFDTHPDDWPGCVYDDTAYSATIESLRARFGDTIFIGKGIEVCFQPDRMDFILDFLDGHSFDLVMLSVHYFGAEPLHDRDRWNGIDVAEGTRRYLATVLEAVQFVRRLHQRSGRVFDVLGHLDLAKRYTQRFKGSYDVSTSQALIDDILRTCLEAELTPEINTSSLRQGLDEPMPGADTVARYARFGGTCMSLGSDAHRSEDIGAGFDRAVSMLRSAGITHTTHFRRRRQTDVPFAASA